MIQDETLDRLLLALTQSPTDQDLIRVIGDRLEDVGRPSAEWWRENAVEAKNIPMEGGQEFLGCSASDGENS